MRYAEYLRDLERYHGFTRRQLACYLGVPVDTLNKWMGGTTKPPAVVRRLLVVLERIMDDAPALHSYLIEQAKTR